MTRAAALLLIAGAGATTGACVSAVVPVGVGTTMTTSGAAGEALVPAGMQFLYGSGEAAALDHQAYSGLTDYIATMAAERAAGHDVRSAVLAPGSTLDEPVFEPCGDKLLAVVLDVDETTVANLGFEADQAGGMPYDRERWDAWERTGGSHVATVPGVMEMAKAARAGHVAVVFNTNRSAANADRTAAMLTGLGLGPAVHGDTLWLQGDVASGSGKDARRWAISKRYCVIAMAGDQLGDFSDLFNVAGQSIGERRAAASGRQASVMWGHGWFILPNPVYGTALKGTMTEVFPLATRWTPPAMPTAKER